MKAFEQPSARTTRKVAINTVIERVCSHKRDALFIQKKKQTELQMLDRLSEIAKLGTNLYSTNIVLIGSCSHLSSKT